jgi:polysaccharide export outer membrane protein
MGGQYQPKTFIVLCLFLAGCGIPRGAGVQSEVLAVDKKTAEGGIPAEFDVVAVTRSSLDVINKWPGAGAKQYSWINREPHVPNTIIAPGDVLTVKVWDTESNSLLARSGDRVSEITDLNVSPQGTVALPFLGELKVSGMTPEAARATIEENYIASIPSAQVQIVVTPGRANTANLVSGVAQPGAYPLPDRDFTLLGLLSQGGGVQQNLSNPQVRLMRGSGIYGVSIKQLFENPALDTTLRGGDRVIVEEDSRYFLSLGAAGSEALHAFPKETVSALDAISIIGGVQDSRANPQGILILREYPKEALRPNGQGPLHERVVFTLDLTTADGLFSAGTFPVISGDLVYATESRLTSVSTVFGIIGSVLGIANTASGL